MNRNVARPGRDPGRPLVAEAQPVDVLAVLSREPVVCDVVDAGGATVAQHVPTRYADTVLRDYSRRDCRKVNFLMLADGMTEARAAVAALVEAARETLPRLDGWPDSEPVARLRAALARVGGAP